MSSRSGRGAKSTAIKAAMSIANDVAAGNLDPAALEQQAVAECRRLFGYVAGPDDPLWELHVEVARQVLAVGGGIPADELAEWVAVERLREDDSATVEGADDGDGAGTGGSSSCVGAGRVSEPTKPGGLGAGRESCDGSAPAPDATAGPASI